MVYVVQMCEHVKGGRAEVYVVGVFTTLLDASIALGKAFDKACDTYRIDKELDDNKQVAIQCSYYNEGKDFNIDVISYSGNVTHEVFGEIVEVEMNTFNIDLEID